MINDDVRHEVAAKMLEICRENPDVSLQGMVASAMNECLPEGMFALQAPRSGIACNAGVTLANSPGIIDPGYRGEIRCKLVNLSDEAYTVYPLERIAQLVFLPFVNAVFAEVDNLPESSRGEDGYGSTGAM